MNTPIWPAHHLHAVPPPPCTPIRACNRLLVIIVMALVQSSLFAPRFHITTPAGKHAFRRNTIPHKVMKMREKQAKKRAATKSAIDSMRRILKQLNINSFLNETALLTIKWNGITELSPPSTPELIQEDQEIITAIHGHFLTHVDSLEVHYNNYTGYVSSSGSPCSPRDISFIFQEIFGDSDSNWGEA